MWRFLLTLVSLCKSIFLPSCCRMERELILSWKRLWFRWWHSPSSLVKFLWYHCKLHLPAITVWYSWSKIITMKALVPQKDEVSVRQFLKFTFICKTFIFENIIKKSYLLIFVPKRKGFKLKSNVKLSGINQL